MTELYTNIDELPEYNFDAINRTGDLSYLSKTKTKGKITKEFEDIWEKIMDEFIVEFGINEKFKFAMMYQMQAIRHYKNAYVDGKRHEINFAKIAEKKAEALMKTDSNMSIGKLASIMAMKMGQRINIREISVREFHQNLITIQENA